MGKCCIHSVRGHSKDTNQFSDSGPIPYAFASLIGSVLRCTTSACYYASMGRSVLVLDLLQKCAGMAEVVGKFDEGGYLPE